MRASFVLLVALLFPAQWLAAESWEQTLTAGAPGPFPEARPLRAIYSFGWSGVAAARAEIHFTKPAADRVQLEGSGGTTGMVRNLWKFDVSQTATASSATMRPLEMQQVETAHGKKITTRLAFDASGVTRTRSDGEGAAGKAKQFASPNLFDLHSALLYLRSLPLQKGDVQRIAVYPSTSAYLATVTAVGRESLKTEAGSYNAIRLDLRLEKIGKNRALEPHKKFKTATAWLSDDADRLLLKIEAEIFVGKVFLELQSAKFDGA